MPDRKERPETTWGIRNEANLACKGQRDDGRAGKSKKKTCNEFRLCLFVAKSYR